MGRGASTQIAEQSPGLRFQGQRSQRASRARLEAMIYEPPHQQSDQIERIYWERDQDPDQVFASLTGSDPEPWQQMLENYTDVQTGFRLSLPDDVSGLPNPWEHGQTTSLYTEIIDFHCKSEICNETDGNKVGDFGLHIYLRPDHTLGIQLGPADLRQHPDHPEHRDDQRTGRGFVTRLVGAIEKQARQGDINELSVHAVNIGSYAWATMGFDFDPRRHDPGQGDLDQILHAHTRDLGESMLFHLQEPAAERPQLQPVIDELEHRIQAGPLSLSELAQWGREHAWTEQGREMWAGKYGIIHAGDWDGVKLL